MFVMVTMSNPDSVYVTPRMPNRPGKNDRISMIGDIDAFSTPTPHPSPRSQPCPLEGIAPRFTRNKLQHANAMQVEVAALA